MCDIGVNDNLKVTKFIPLTLVIIYSFPSFSIFVKKVFENKGKKVSEFSK